MNEPERAAERNVTALRVSAFVAGAAAGVATALVLAPATGRDTRAYLKRRSNELADDAVMRGKMALGTQSKRVTSAVSSGWRRAGDAVRHAYDRGVEAYRNAAPRALHQARGDGRDQAAAPGFNRS